jgi:hypothetical protein
MQPGNARTRRRAYESLARDIRDATHRVEAYRRLLGLACYIRDKGKPSDVPFEEAIIGLSGQQADLKLFELVQDLHQSGDEKAIEAWRVWQKTEGEPIGLFIDRMKALVAEAERQR